MCLSHGNVMRQGGYHTYAVMDELSDEVVDERSSSCCQVAWTAWDAQPRLKITALEGSTCSTQNEQARYRALALIPPQ